MISPKPGQAECISNSPRRLVADAVGTALLLIIAVIGSGIMPHGMTAIDPGDRLANDLAVLVTFVTPVNRKAMACGACHRLDVECRRVGGDEKSEGWSAPAGSRSGQPHLLFIEWPARPGLVVSDAVPSYTPDGNLP